MEDNIRLATKNIQQRNQTPRAPENYGPATLSAIPAHSQSDIQM